VEDINLIQMFWHAGIIVKMVMLILLFFSCMSWYIVFDKFKLFKQTDNLSADFLDMFWNCRNLADAYRQTENTDNCPEVNIFRAGFKELQKISRNRSGDQTDTLKMQIAGMDNLKRVLEKVSGQENQRLGSSLPFLATTGSATPFIGLFGTVWGIMAAFKEIGIRGSASLAVVAPGISEALVATAAGLAVAIPAVIFYNHYANRLDLVDSQMDNFCADFMNLVERDMISRQDDPKE